MAIFITPNVNANFTNPFDDGEERPLLFNSSGKQHVAESSLPVLKTAPVSATPPVTTKVSKASTRKTNSKRTSSNNRQTIADLPSTTIEVVRRPVVEEQKLDVSKTVVAEPNSVVEKPASAQEKLAEAKLLVEKAKQEAREKERELKALEIQAQKQAYIDAENARIARIEQAKKEREDAKLKRQAEKAEIERKRLEAIELNRQKLEAEREARLEAEKQRKEKIKAEKERKEKAEAERLAQIKAEAEERVRLKLEAEALAKQQAAAKLKQEEENRLRIKMEAEAERKAKEEAQRQAKLDAELKAQAERLAKEKLEAERLEKEALAKQKLEAERLEKEALAKQKLEAERLEKEALAKQKLEAERLEKEALAKQKLEAERLEKEALAKQKLEAERLEKEALAKQKLEAERLAKAKTSEYSGLSAATNFGSVPSAQNGAVSLAGPTYANRATQSALQRATSKIAIDPAKMPLRNRVLGYTASAAQLDALNERYKYDATKLAVLPKQIGDIKLIPVARLTGDTIALFATPSEKRLVEEYLSYHPLHAQVFSNYVKRVMTTNDGVTEGVSVDAAILNELTYNFASIAVPSSTIGSAQDKYLYIVSRLNDADQVKFWNWVNTVKTGNEIQVPAWIRLADALYSN